MGRSFSLPIKQEEGGAAGTDTIFTQNPDWLRERPETDQSRSSNQIQSCREESGPQPVVNQEEVVIVKQEVDDGHMMLEIVDISSQQEGRYTENSHFYTG